MVAHAPGVTPWTDADTRWRRDLYNSLCRRTSGISPASKATTGTPQALASTRVRGSFFICRMTAPWRRLGQLTSSCRLHLDIRPPPGLPKRTYDTRGLPLQSLWGERQRSPQAPASTVSIADCVVLSCASKGRAYGQVTVIQDPLRPYAAFTRII